MRNFSQLARTTQTKFMRRKPSNETSFPIHYPGEWILQTAQVVGVWPQVDVYLNLNEHFSNQITPRTEILVRLHTKESEEERHCHMCVRWFDAPPQKLQFRTRAAGGRFSKSAKLQRLRIKLNLIKIKLHSKCKCEEEVLQSLCFIVQITPFVDYLFLFNHSTAALWRTRGRGSSSSCRIIYISSMRRRWWGCRRQTER